MASRIEGRVEGLETVLSRLKHLRKPSTRTKILRKALNKGTTPVNNAAKSKAPKRTGRLKISIGRKTKTYTKTGSVVVLIGPRKGQGKTVMIKGEPVFVDPVRYAHLVEKGHSGPHAAPPHPFLRPAWDSTKGQAAEIIQREIGEGIEAEVSAAK